MEEILKILEEEHWEATKVEDGIRLVWHLYGGIKGDLGIIPCKSKKEFIQQFALAANEFDIDDYVLFMFERVDRGVYQSKTQRLFVDACTLQNAFKSTLIRLKELTVRRTVKITMEKVQRISKEYEGPVNS